MALKSTIFKAHLAIADIDHGYYADHSLTLARHPSETDERMMVRLVALALNAWQLQALCGGDGTLAFGAGLCDPDDPDVHITDFTGAKRLWIEGRAGVDLAYLTALGIHEKRRRSILITDSSQSVRIKGQICHSGARYDRSDCLRTRIIVIADHA